MKLKINCDYIKSSREWVNWVLRSRNINFFHCLLTNVIKAQTRMFSTCSHLPIFSYQLNFHNNPFKLLIRLTNDRGHIQARFFSLFPFHFAFFLIKIIFTDLHFQLLARQHKKREKRLKLIKEHKISIKFYRHAGSAPTD